MHTNARVKRGFGWFRRKPDEEHEEDAESAATREVVWHEPDANGRIEPSFDRVSRQYADSDAGYDGEDEDVEEGSDEDEDPAGYHLRLVLTQKGAAVEAATSAKYEAEHDPSAPPPKGRLPRLRLIGDVPRSDAPGSLSMTLASAARIAQPDAEDHSRIVRGKVAAAAHLI